MIYFLGDIHGAVNDLAVHVDVYLDIGDTLIQVGDFGIGFFKRFKDDLHQIDSWLESDNKKVYVVRGNHDNPKYFDGTFNEFKNIIFVKDYSVLDVENKKILCVGGGISVDRIARTVGTNYWLDEKFFFDKEKIKNIKPDIVVTHTCPSFIPPIGVDAPIINGYVQHEIKVGRNLKRELLDERNDVSKLYRNINKENLTHWFYGHFHQHFNTIYENINFIGLDIKELYSIK